MKILPVVLLLSSMTLVGCAHTDSVQTTHQAPEVVAKEKIIQAFDMFVKARAEKSTEQMLEAITILDHVMPASGSNEGASTQTLDMVDEFIKELVAMGGHYERKPKPKTRGLSMGDTVKFAYYSLLPKFECTVLGGIGHEEVSLPYKKKEKRWRLRAWTGQENVNLKVFDNKNNFHEHAKNLKQLIPEDSWQPDDEGTYTFLMKNKSKKPAVVCGCWRQC